MKKFLTAMLFLASFVAHAVTTNVTPTTASQAINASAAGDTIQFGAGSYGVLTLKTGVHYLGTPSASFAAATLSGSTLPTVVEAMHFVNNGTIYVSPNAANLTFTGNTFTGLTGTAIFFDGGAGTSLTNVLMTNNVFGDATSCAAVFALNTDQGGNCAGFRVNAQVITGLHVNHNSFIHVEEGLHLQQNSFAVGAKEFYCDDCDIEYNYFLNGHRINAEIQTGSLNHPTIFSHNVIQDNLNQYYGTLTLSTPCCQWGVLDATVTNIPQALIEQDNVIISSVSATPAPYGIEFWGTGSQASGNIIQGNICNGITWGYGEGNWAISNNLIQGASMAPGGCGGYITSEEGQTNAPAITGNTTGSTPTATLSQSPVITQSTSAVSIAVAVNESAYYTTDGSTPTVKSNLYTGPFTPAAGATVKVIGMWGVAPLPTSFPANYGYIPSPVGSAVFVGQPVIVTPPPPPPPPPVVPTCVVAVKGNVITVTCNSAVSVTQ